MKTKFKVSILTLSVALLFVFVVPFLYVVQNKSSVDLNNYGNVYLKNYAQEYYNKSTGSFQDIKNGHVGQCNVEEHYLQSGEETAQQFNDTISNHKTCNSISSSHGDGGGGISDAESS